MIKIHNFENNYFKSTLSSDNINNENMITLYSPTLITSKNITKVHGKYSYNLNFNRSVLKWWNLYLNDYKYSSYSYNIL